MPGVDGIPAFKELKDVFTNEAAAIKYLHSHGCLNIPTHCVQCWEPVKYRPNKKNRVCCRRRDCTSAHGMWSQSIFKGTFFMGCRLPINEVMHMLYLFVLGISNKSVQGHFRWSKNTVTEWMRFAEQLVSEVVLDNEENYAVGGPGLIVEIDEAKLGKRKHNRGHPVDGVWVFGGVERTPERKCFMVAVPDRTRTTLFYFIKKFILPGTLIMSDGWSSYATLDELEGYYYEHQTVVHEHTFVDPDTGCCTNTIEGTWAGLKHLVPPRKRTEEDIPARLLLFMWKRIHAGRLWDALLEALRDVRWEE